MTDPSSFQTNRDLFSNHYLTDTLRDREPWTEVSDEEVREAYEEISDLVDSKLDRVEDYNEAQLERNLIRPIFDILGIPFEIEETVERNARRPDYGFFPSDEAADAAFDRADFYEESIAVADAKRWGRKLDTRGEEKRDFENPSYQIHRYLQETPTQWGVLTNGAQWRLYYEPTSHRLDSYYEIDLPAILDTVAEEDGIESFKYFYLFFRQEAFLPDKTGDCFLDDVYNKSNVFAEELGEDLQENIYDAIRVLAEGFIETNEELDEADLDLIHDSSLIYLYRLIFVLYAESEGRNLLPTNNEIYSSSYSLNELKLKVVENRDETQQHYQSWQTDLWEQLDELFVLIDKGSKGEGIPKDDLYIPAYNGGLFRTCPDEDDTDESQFLSNHEVGDAYIAEVIELLTRHEASEGDGKVFVDYSSLDERNLGSIYEGLLEYKLDVASEPLTVDDGEYTSAGEGDDVTVDEGEVYLRTDDGERKATGSYYTPEYVVEYIVDETLGPLVEDIREDMLAESARGDEQAFAEEFADRVFDLTVLDPAMGSGHFLVNAVDYLAREIIDAQEQQDRQALESPEAKIRSPTTDDGELRDINWARRKVAQRCIYGVDVNPLATELAKVSLWLRTLAAEQPLAFLDHHLKTGNSLVGSDIEEVLTNGDEDATEDGQLTLQESFDHTRRRAMEHITDRFQDLLSIDNETLEDAKEMEAVYDEVRADPLYRKLLAMANVHTADNFGLDIPSDAYERMARALQSEDWQTISKQEWFKRSQSMAKNDRFFHWELEFPIAFYDQDGQRKTDAGFDAVIGNPPYVGEKERKDMFEFLKKCSIVKEVYQGRMDILYFFVVLGIKLTNESGSSSMITTSYWPEADSAGNLRNEITNRTDVSEIIEFSEYTVFEEAPGQQNLIYKFDNSGSEEITFSYIRSAEYESDAVAESLLNEKDLFYQETYNYNEFELPTDGSEWYGIKGLAKGALELPNTGQKLSEFVESKQGIVPNPDRVTSQSYEEYENEDVDIGEGVFLLDDDDLDRIGIDDDHELLKPAYSNSNISRYNISYPDNLYILYIKSSVDIDQYPQIKKHLNRYRSKLDDRREVKDGSIRWYSLQWPRNSQLFQTPKIVYSNWGNDWQPYAIEKKGYYERRDITLLKPVHSNVDLQRLTAILNSKLSEYWQTEQRSRAGYTTQESLDSMPVPDASEQDNNKRQLAELAQKISEIKNKRATLNLNLFDYLGISSDELPESKAGDTIEDLQTPIKGVASTPLAKTTTEYEGLRIEDVSFEDSTEQLELSIDISYKVDDESRDTDRWGRLSESAFESYEAMVFDDLSEEKKTLIKEFVPIVVEKADGFADFRRDASKTNSPIDRLNNLTLPDLGEIKKGLQKYIQTKERADKLDEKIEEKDQLIDKIVYDLYDLTDEEIEVVEETVTDD
jgi:type II restriction/modification system DNA methylase subunit YeeA